MGDFDSRAFGLADLGEQFLEPRGVDVEGFAAFDAVELDGAERVVAVLVVADDAAFAAQGAFHGEVDAAFDEALVGIVGGGGAAEVAALLDEGFLGADAVRRTAWRTMRRG